MEEDGTELGVIAFESLPQLPISRITLHLSSAVEILETANECGTFRARTYFEPWDQALSTEVVNNEMSLNSGPGGTPCPGPASNISLSLSPVSIPADGAATTMTTAHVTDANGGPAIGDSVEFRPSDAGERVGPVTEAAEGVYRATITSSRTPGRVTITAVDSSVTPSVTGTATLEQTGRTLDKQGAEAEVPLARISRHPRSRSRNRRPLFAFTASVSGASFLCSVDGKPYRPCSSPLRLKKLTPGNHRFRVLAVSAAGQRGDPAIFHFKVLIAAPRRMVKR